jgi:hypothetical protein
VCVGSIPTRTSNFRLQTKIPQFSIFATSAVSRPLYGE